MTWTIQPTAGQLINGKYRILRLIAEGSLGSVYEASHERLGTRVALKLLRIERSRDPALVERFLQEARSVALIESEHVVRLLDVDRTESGAPFLVLELLEGKTLDDRLAELRRSGERLSLSDAMTLSLHLLEGLEAAHKAGVVHRDLRPRNVMIVSMRGAPVAKILDFGTAKLRSQGRGFTRPGTIMGTPEYMAPEQHDATSQVDARADIFALGVLIFEMISGQRPVASDDPDEIVATYRMGRAARLATLVPNVDPNVAAAVEKAIASNASDRFTDAAEMRAMIEAPFSSWVQTSQRGAAQPDKGGTELVPQGIGVPPTDREPAPVRGTIMDDQPAQPATTMAGGTTAPEHERPPATLRDPIAAAPPQRRRPRSSSNLALILLLLVIIGGGVAATLLVMRNRDDDSTSTKRPVPTAASTPPPVVTPAPLPPPPPPATTTAPPPTPGTTPTAHPSGNKPINPFPVPTLPPVVIPSALPSSLPIPSGLPPLPTFP